MNKTRLHEEFIKELNKKIPRRSELIDAISEVLKIEREPISRRLSEKVQFSIYEMGLLAKEFGISLDALLYKDTDFEHHWFPLVLESPLGVKSMDVLYDIIDINLDQMAEISHGSTEFSSVFNSLPLEYYVHHPYLMKFMLFKWGYYFVGTDEFNDFSTWKLPKRVNSLKERIEDILVKSDHTLYIWDESLIWILVNEIDYFYRAGVICLEDVEHIKTDLKESLVNLEKYVGGITKPVKSSKSLSFYVSRMSLGVTSWHLSSEIGQAYSFKTNFTFLSSINSYKNQEQVKEWIDSFKKISVLISESGALERRLFFAKQYKIIDEFLK